MKTLLWAVGVAVILVVVVTIVGYALPQGHRATRERVFAAPPDTLYALITRTADYPAWRSGVTRVEALPDVDGRPSFRETSGGDAITFVFDQLVPGQRVVSRIADASLPFGGRWIHEIEPVDAGARLRITEEGEVYNPIFRFVSRFIMGHTSSIDRFLDDVARRTGDTAAGPR